MTGPLSHLLLARDLDQKSGRLQRYGSPAIKQERPPALLGSFGVSGLKRSEMPTEDNENHPMDASNSIHK
ncbi:unnamed protein product [Penicillium camemberti]|uniref:Str. FM013 n=1 Tax=Penicillium camemberti (strain FM 013) TaxID=1429867 RepID=A0A0G4PXU0_PENC3|nr:unnamed protein product [Penicillium camemberti]